MIKIVHAMKIYKVAIIGCGRIAEHNCRAIINTEGLQLKAVCDLDIKKANIYCDAFGVPAFINYHAMLREISDIDIVAIITPSGMHFEHSLDILNNYKKHIIVEKPTFMRPSQLNEAYRVANKLNLKIFPVFQNRHNLAVQKVKTAIEKKELGDIRTVGVRVRWCRPQSYYDMAPWRGTFSHDGGALTNQGIHHVDLLRYLGGEVEKVNATMRTLGSDIEVEDTVVASFAYVNGSVGSLEVTTAARPSDFEASLSIVGSKGLAQIGGIAVNELQIFTPDSDACSAYSEDFSDCVYGNGHKIIYENIYDSMANDISYPITKEDCLKSIRLLHAFYRSNEKIGWQDPNEQGESTRLGRRDNAISQLYRTISY
jgi:UDP-N-acetyl-2-amino-2-deoxyglucuronate dehydrogenase